jgi:asparagine synthetase B (glutamine-hydrolysing)
MCGIAGAVRLGKDPITPEMVNSLLLGVQHRGGDATGIAMMTKNKLSFFKKDEIAWKFCSLPEYREFLRKELTPETQTVILHTRAWTLGSPHKNENNHPVTVGKAAIVHNGGISNHAQLFAELKLKREAEVDSDIIRAIVDKYGITKQALRTLNKMSGSCASAIIHKDFPRELMLLHSGSPLVIGQFKGFLMWASEKKAIHVASRLWEKRWGMFWQKNRSDLMFNPVHRESGLILNIDEMIENENNPEWTPWHDKFTSCSNYIAPKYDVHGKFHMNQQRKSAEAEKEERAKTQPVAPPPLKESPITAVGAVEPSTHESHYVQCPNPDCEASLEIESKYRKVDLKLMACCFCKTLLADDPTLHN